MYLAYSADPTAALDAYDHAVALDPYGSDDLRSETVAEANFNLGRHEESITVLRTMLGLPISYVHQQLAINFGMLGDLDALDHHLALHNAQRPPWFDEMELFESHMLICQDGRDRGALASRLPSRRARRLIRSRQASGLRWGQPGLRISDHGLGPSSLFEERLLMQPLLLDIEPIQTRAEPSDERMHDEAQHQVHDHGEQN